MTRTPWLCLALLAAACGGDIGSGNGDEGGSDGGGAGADAARDDAALIECSAPGSGSVTSTTAGAEVTPVMSAWYQVVDPETPAAALVIDERASNCDPDSISDQPGQLVTIYFCSQLVAGEYAAVPQLAGACPDTPQVSVNVVNQLLVDVVTDTTGTLTIQQAGDCIVGSFDTTTPDAEELSGSFMAYLCPPP